MPLSTFSFKRPITSYSKVETLVGSLIRNRRFQLNRLPLSGDVYVDIGAGRTVHDGFLHVDYEWHRQIDVCWDVREGLPFASGTLAGVYSQHMFEHFSLPVVTQLLRECRRVLKPGGTIRISVPELYIRAYLNHLDGDGSAVFPYGEYDHIESIRSPLLGVNRIFYTDRDSLFGHRTMYDFHLLKSLLEAAGFGAVAKNAFREGRDPRLLVDCLHRRGESLYVEASVPDASVAAG
jgi:predicted SAM-dependent methyltransferase